VSSSNACKSNTEKTTSWYAWFRPGSIDELGRFYKILPDLTLDGLTRKKNNQSNENGSAIIINVTIFCTKKSNKYFDKNETDNSTSIDLNPKQEEVFICGHPQFLMQKTSDFLKFVVCLHEQVEGVTSGRGMNRDVKKRFF